MIAFLDENRTQDFFDIIAGINNGIKEIYEYYPSDVEPALFVSVDSENDSKKIFILIKTKQDAEQATNSLYKTLDRWLVDEQAFINSNLGIINEPITVSME